MTTIHNPPVLNHYTVDYVFDGYQRVEDHNAIATVIRTVEEMQRGGVDIDFLGATQKIDATGQLTEITVRYASPSKGTIGWVNCRACLPASGPPQREETDGTESLARQKTSQATTSP